MQAIDKAGNTQEATNKDTEAFIKVEPQTLPEMIANGYIKAGNYIDYDVEMELEQPMDNIQ